jgi:hypothetical protein
LETGEKYRVKGSSILKQYPLSVIIKATPRNNINKNNAQDLHIHKVSIFAMTISVAAIFFLVWFPSGGPERCLRNIIGPFTKV